MKYLFLFILFAIAAGFASAQNPEAVILEITGTVELKTSGSSAWVAAKAGDRLARDTVVSTGFKSGAVISVGNSIIVAQPLTRLSLTELISRDETETAELNLGAGRIKVEVNPPAGSKASFKVQTPMAVASVRGTKFEMNTAEILVEEGSVFYQPENSPLSRPVTVSAGRESWIDSPTGRAVHPMAAGEAARRFPAMPGEKAAPRSGGARVTAPESSGSLTVDIVF